MLAPIWLVMSVNSDSNFMHCAPIFSQTKERGSKPCLEAACALKRRRQAAAAQHKGADTRALRRHKVRCCHWGLVTDELRPQLPGCGNVRNRGPSCPTLSSLTAFRANLPPASDEHSAFVLVVTHETSGVPMSNALD